MGVPNIVTSVLASYRGYDTLGETMVVFAAGISVLSLLGLRRRRTDLEAPEDAPGDTPAGGHGPDIDEPGIDTPDIDTDIDKPGLDTAGVDKL